MSRELFVGAVVRREKEILLVRQSAGHPLEGQWTTPWGRVEPGESPMSAAVREAMEEGGISARVESLLGVQELPAPQLGGGALVYLCEHGRESLIRLIESVMRLVTAPFPCWTRSSAWSLGSTGSSEGYLRSAPPPTIAIAGMPDAPSGASVSPMVTSAYAQRIHKTSQCDGRRQPGARGRGR